MSQYIVYPSTSGGGVPVYPTFADFPAGTFQGQLAVAADTGDIFEWNGSAWVLEASPSGAGPAPGSTGDLLYNSGGVVAADPAFTTDGSGHLSAASLNLSGTITASNFSGSSSGTNTGDVTIGTADGLSLSGQVLSLALATISTPGAVPNIGGANGVAPLDSGSKIPVAYLPSTVMLYLGNWDASTNTPTLADGTGTNGDVYRVSVAGTQNLGSGPQTFFVGDFVIYNGTIWQRSPTADGVTSVNGLQGDVILTRGNLTDAGTDGITVTGGTNAVWGSGTSLSQHVADATHNGYLSSADWSTFNSKQAAGSYITALTGDVTATGPGSVAATLAAVNSNVGSFTNANITVNAKGLITAASNGSASGANTSLSNLAAVAINTSLLPGVTDSIDLGSATKAWNNLYADQLLKNSSNTSSINLQTAQITDTASTLSIDWDNRFLKDNTPITSLDWGTRHLIDTSSVTSLDWGLRELFSPSGAIQLTWASSGVKLNQVTASRALTTNASQIITASTTTDAELAFVHGVTSNIQTQLNGKQATAIAPTRQVFTSGTAATYTTPAGVLYLKVTLVGGGGGGGSSNSGTSGNAGGGGGGGAGTSILYINNPTSTYTYTVGTGGAGGTNSSTNGVDGNTTSFSTASAAGGTHGNGSSGVNNPGAGGTGGAGSSGTINFSGGSGSTGSSGVASVTAGTAGLGGSSFMGGGGSNGSNGGANGVNGNNYGGGGGGAAQGGTAGTGANGIIIVEEYYQ